MNRYSVIHKKIPRELVLLQGSGCRWGKCLFCDYHADKSDNPYIINKQVLSKVTGVYGVLDIINSGSAIELDENIAEAYAGLGFIFCEEENHKSAIKFLKRAHELAPFNTDYLFCVFGH